MNAVEIEEAVSELAAAPFDAAEFPFRFLAAFGMKDTTVKRLRSRSSNLSDITGGVLQRNNIHLAIAPSGKVGTTLAALRDSLKTGSAKAKFVLATDGATLEAEDLVSGEPLACAYTDFGQHFGFFLPLAGISTVKEIKNNPIDVKATGRLNKLYVELLKDNPDWATEARRPALNQFMARLIFCFFAEDTGIFHGSYLFTPTIERMSDSQAGNAHEVIGQLFRAMGTLAKDRAAGNFRPWADGFPYVNGGLFTGDADCPKFSKIARAYLLSAGTLNWKEINPDIFGSMIQAVADDEERGALGMHYTSVPNILKVLNPLFLDDLREQLATAENNNRKLRNLRRRLAAVRVFDPACGSGNFLVIAYLHMREIEAEIVRRTGDEPRSVIRLNNFYGIEIKGFAAEIARLALLIAEFQADCRHIGQQEARSMVLPLHKTGQIHVGNALHLDWLRVCPPVNRETLEEHDLAGPTGKLALDETSLGERAEPATYICGNPPYVGSKKQTDTQRSDLQKVFYGQDVQSKTLDYVAGWFFQAVRHVRQCNSAVAFVATNSVCQGEQVAALWPSLLGGDNEISFAHRSFPWRNLASANAVVTCVVVGIRRKINLPKTLYENDLARRVHNIGPYLVEMDNTVVDRASSPTGELPPMNFGNHPYYGGDLIVSQDQKSRIVEEFPESAPFIKPLFGTDEFIDGLPRYCIWLDSKSASFLSHVFPIAERVERVKQRRNGATRDVAALKLAHHPYRFRDQKMALHHLIIVARHSSEVRPYLPVDLLSEQAVVSDAAFALYDAPLWALSLISSRLHLVWIATVCGKLETRYRYSNTLGWNTFLVPHLTTQDKAALTICAKTILLTRESHFPATIADLYDPETMPDDLRRAHEANDETLERIYIGRRFRNDTERLEKLFELYTKMVATGPQPKPKGRRAA